MIRALASFGKRPHDRSVMTPCIDVIFLFSKQPSWHLQLTFSTRICCTPILVPRHSIEGCFSVKNQIEVIYGVAYLNPSKPLSSGSIQSQQTGGALSFHLPNMMKLPFAITIPTRPCMGSTIVLANDSAIYCFGGRLENRELTRYHYVSDVETCLWETIHAAPSPESESEDEAAAADVDIGVIDIDVVTVTGVADIYLLASMPTQDTKTRDDGETIGAKQPTGPEAYLSLTLTTDPTDTNSGSISGVASLCPRPRYFYALNAFGTSLVLFRGVGKIVGNEADETKQQNGNNNRSETTIEDQTDESHWDFAI
ncbi:hypothetical protein BX616_005237 [Lobosporangium transversale]|nr:hypothetical protein BX616_005237 [Lobosporangium transversale]